MSTQGVAGTTFTAEVTGGSVENLNRVATGEMDMGMAMGTTLAKALEGDAADRFAGIRVIAPLYPNVAHFLVRPGSAIATFGELLGKRLSIGVAGSGTEQMSRDLLTAYGLSVENVEPRYLSFSESAAALRDGAIDAALLSVGYPAAAVLEATTAGVRLVGLQPDGIDSLMARFPYYRPASIPAGVYPGVDEALPTAAVLNWLFADEALEDAIIETLLEILATRRDELGQVNAIAAQIDLGNLGEAPLPLHPAAAAWMAAR